MRAWVSCAWTYLFRMHAIPSCVFYYCWGEWVCEGDEREGVWGGVSGWRCERKWMMRGSECVRVKVLRGVCEGEGVEVSVWGWRWWEGVSEDEGVEVSEGESDEGEWACVGWRCECVRVKVMRESECVRVKVLSESVWGWRCCCCYACNLTYLIQILP